MHAQTDETPLFCDRCTVDLHPGRGDFFVVKIEAVADPTPPEFSEEDLNRDHKGEIQRLLAQIEEMSEREATALKALAASKRAGPVTPTPTPPKPPKAPKSSSGASSGSGSSE